MEPNEELLRAVIRVETDRAPSALATVVRVRGSTPRSAGASMLIEASGATVGTIGGGCGEADVLRAARAVIASGQAQLVHVELTDDVASLSPAVCGGVMDVLVEPVVRSHAPPTRGPGSGA
jgi:xanthine dehydrogenase accessory factor